MELVLQRCVFGAVRSVQPRNDQARICERSIK